MDYNEVLERLNELNVSDLFGTKKEVKELPNVLKGSEKIMYVTSGFMDSNTWLIVCTNERVLFLDKGMFFGLKQVEIPLDKINSISYKAKMVLGDIHVSHGSAEVVIKSVAKRTIKPMVDAINLEMTKIKTRAQNETSNISGADEILKFKQLLDQGIITEEEFNAKKKQLLGI